MKRSLVSSPSDIKGRLGRGLSATADFCKKNRGRDEPATCGKNRVIASGLSARLSVSVFVSVPASVSASVCAPVSSSTPSARPRLPAQETCRALNAAAPVAKARPQRQEWHGLPLHDPYAWLRADNWQEVLGNPEALDKEIMALLQAEGMHSEEVLAAVKPLRAALFVDLKSRIAETEESVKRKRGTWLYWKRWRTGSEYPVHLRAPRSSQDISSQGTPSRETTTSESPEVVLDEAVLAEGKDFFRLLGAEVSPDQKSLAFVADLRGQEHGTLRIRRITGREDGIDAPTAQISTAGLCNGDFAFTADGTGLYYVRPDENHRPSAVWLHRLGRDAGDDRLIWHEADPAYFVSLERQASSDAAGGVILLHLHDHAASEYRLLSACPDDRQQAGEQEETVPCIFSRRQVVQAEILHDLPRKRFLILREEAQGQEFRLDALSEEQAQAEQGLSTTADTLLAVQAGQSLISLEANQQRALLIVNQAGKPALGLLNLQDDSLTLQAAPEAIGALALAPVLEYEADELFFSFSSPCTPPSFWRLQGDKAPEELWQKPAPRHKRQDYISEEQHYTSPDGTAIPVQLLRRRDAKPQQPLPTLLYGYGAYGIPESGHFSITRLALVDLGWQHAAARIRGGDDLGRHWYREGKLAQKENSFHDFIAVARGLIAEQRTTPQDLAIHGGSAGGLLVGAVLNRAPELFQAALAVVPFVDILNTILDDSLPLTPPEWREWGNPVADKEAFLRIQSYAPYENIGALAYPWLLATAGISDPRVTYWEPLKWVQKIRAVAGDSARGAILLQCNLAAGHGGASGRYRRLAEVARDWAFLLLACGQSEQAEKILRSRGLWQAADAGSPDTEATNAESPDTGIEDTGAEV